MTKPRFKSGHKVRINKKRYQNCRVGFDDFFALVDDAITGSGLKLKEVDSELNVVL
jgi:hypothetical protein